ncbi:hypothetical protein C2845_PM18G12300 [Panicum miliaceum]|uniref:Uncharacterized protein n=1 Tax=Panicum miliaceum TaxID=4540 RepID=A0A3L6PJZ1_PANMI|nr:hypothetical protein C2845_PM18G12300 [Panicum miliaceum]
MGCEVHERGHHAGAHCKGVDGGPRGRHGRGQADAAAAAYPLGELPRGPLRPPCAPRGVRHAAFYGELDRAAAPACHLVAGDYGHPNMMDDDTPGARGIEYVLIRHGDADACDLQERRGQGIHAAVRGRRHRRRPSPS